MTRETRIGLLVGLGFIVMFGLVLTELTGGSQSAPLPGSLKDAAMLRMASSADVSPVVVEPRVLSPRLGPAVPQASGTPLMAAGGEAPHPGPAVAAVIQSPVPGSRQMAAALAPEAPSPVRVTSADELVLVAVVSVDPAPSAPAAASPPAAARTYTVQSGDSLIKIARKVYGPDRQREYRRIYEANRGALASPETIPVGQVLVIPELDGVAAAASPAAAAAPAGGPSMREVELGQLAQALGVGPGEAARVVVTRTGGHVIYVVRRGDTLAKIARRTLNNDSHAAVMSIYQANKGKLSHPDRLPVGVELVIPS